VVRALVLSNMLPDARHPERGRFVRDQARALQALEDVEVEFFEFSPGGRALLAATRTLARRFRGRRLDVVHAHFGLTAWPGLAVRARARAVTLHGTDVRHPRTRQATRAVLPLMGLVGAASPALAEELPGRAARRRAQVLPCGVDLDRFRPIPRQQARTALGLDPERPYLLFPADPSRPEKRHDRARAVAGEVELLSLGGVEPERVALWINAANAVLVPSEREGFGLAALEAIACGVPVLATPVGAHPEILDGLAGTLCAPFELDRWRAALAPHLLAGDPRIDGVERVRAYSTEHMAKRVADAWRTLLKQGG
jgi:teichuronic acid biosynthesis glycosyltransferase TuaC